MLSGLFVIAVGGGGDSGGLVKKQTCHLPPFILWNLKCMAA